MSRGVPNALLSKDLSTVDFKGGDNRSYLFKKPEENPIKPVRTYKLQSEVVRVKQMGALLISSSADSRLRVWSTDPRSGLLKLEKALKGHTAPPTRMAIENGQLYTCSHRDTVLKAWDLQTYELFRDFEGHKDYISDLRVIPSENVVYTSSFDQTIRTWDLRNGQCTQLFSGHADAITQIKTQKDLLISSSADKTIKTWDRRNASKCIKTLEGHTHMVYGTMVNGLQLLSYSQDGTVRTWKLKTGEPKNKIELGYPVKHLDIIKNNAYTLSKTAVDVWSLKGKKLFSMEGHTSAVLSTKRYRNYMITGSQDRTIRIWDAKKGKQLMLLRGHEEAVNTIEIKDKFIYSGGADGTIRQWENNFFLAEADHGWV